jgi:aspartyl-tRNA synthetase
LDELKRTHRCGALREEHVEQSAVLFGWVDSRRDHGNCIFIDLRDRDGITQIVFDPGIDEESHRLAEAMRPEWVIGVKGVVGKVPM